MICSPGKGEPNPDLSPEVQCVFHTPFSTLSVDRDLKMHRAQGAGLWSDTAAGASYTRAWSPVPGKAGTQCEVRTAPQLRGTVTAPGHHDVTGYRVPGTLIGLLFCLERTHLRGTQIHVTLFCCLHNTFLMLIKCHLQPALKSISCGPNL